MFLQSLRANANVITRLGFLATGAYLLYVALLEWARMGDSLHPFMIALGFATYFFAFALIVLAVSGYAVERFQILILLALIFALVVQFYMQVADRPRIYGTDNLAFTHYAADLFIQGQNPYQADMGPSLEQFNVSPLWRTPTLDGSYETQFPYPALHFLIYVPFLLAGIDDMRIAVLIFHVLVLVTVYLAAPRGLRPLVLIPFFIDPNVVGFTLGTVSDFIWVWFALAAAILLPRHRLMSAVFFGLAIAMKQPPWFLAPFLGIMIFRETQRSARSWAEPAWAALAYLDIAGLVFLGINAYFILLSPLEWLRGVLSPLIDPLIMYGQGLSTLAQTGLVEIPKPFFLMAVLAVMAILVILYWKEYPRLKHALWLFPAIILWFSYRSLHSYFFYPMPLMMAGLYAYLREQTQPVSAAEPLSLRIATSPSRQPRPRRLVRTGALAFAAVVAVLLVVFAGTTLLAVRRPTPAVEVVRISIASESSPTLGNISVRVRNPTSRVIQPRFWMKLTGQQMLAWQALTGPTFLPAGQSATFTIGQPYPEHAAPVGATMTILVSDLVNSEMIGSSPAVQLEPSRHSSLTNGNYLYWIPGPSQRRERPFGWGLYIEGDAVAREGLSAQTDREGRSCARLSLVQGSAMPMGSTKFYLDQWTEWPNRQMGLWVYPESAY
ncbi:MAG: hypothetical protein HY782_27750, partial [Chloroflexi bacterium]|nr:hypothetical protein [Chloroflexota bacterium]